MKFIVLEDPLGSRVPIVFPDLLNHCDVARCMARSSEAVYKVVDAGKLSVWSDDDGKMKAQAYGASTTLPDVKPTEKDRQETNVLLSIFFNS
jgi:hypothetical protein